MKLKANSEIGNTAEIQPD